MLGQYSETGGLRWGSSFWRAANATWPFASLRASTDSVTVQLSVFGVWRQSFEFRRGDILSMRRLKGLFSTGVRIEHAKPEYPPFDVFWTLRYSVLKARLIELGYDVLE
jgi:hypothetical protein